MGVMVFCPTTPGRVRRLQAAGRDRLGRGYAATSPMRAHFGYGPDEDEDADYAAQLVASVAALVAGGDRLVLAVEMDAVPRSAGAQEMGEVEVGEVSWRDVRALFRDEPESLEPARAYRGGVLGHPIAMVWEREATTELVEGHSLLWFDPTELEQALDGLQEPTDEGGEG